MVIEIVCEKDRRESESETSTVYLFVLFLFGDYMNIFPTQNIENWQKSEE